MKKLWLLPYVVLFSCSSGFKAWDSSSAARLPASAQPDPANVTYLDQGWNSTNRQAFYFTPQGSHLMPYEWGRKMENAGDSEIFLTSQNLSRFGYIPQAPTTENPDGLPIGFTKDSERKVNYLGINCAACHTSQISYRGQEIRIDGGPSMSNFQAFVLAMDSAIYATADNPEKFERFAARVLGNALGDSRAKEKLKADLAELVSVRKDWQERNRSSMVYGGGRNDAFGIIFNQVLAHNLKQSKGGPVLVENRREPNAPVSYPVLWDAPNHNIVQWIGIARNNLEDKGPLSRNIGQVLGVFGHVDFDDETLLLKGYCSSAKRSNLETLENQVKTLWSPKWPEGIFGALDHEKVARGERTFQTTCVKCHENIDSRAEGRIVHASMVPISVVKTDPKVAKNASLRTALSGQLKGKKLSVAEGRPLEAEEPATVVLRHAVAGALLGSISFLTCNGEIETNPSTILMGWRNVAKKAASGLFTKEELEQPGTLEQRLQQNASIFMRYKARPLNGVWASAPYLHNGSVKNLYEILLPARERSKKFAVGCTNFDPAHAGFDCASGGPGTTVLDASVEGNSNDGHDFAERLSDGERSDLLEYLKSL